MFFETKYSFYEYQVMSFKLSNNLKNISKLEYQNIRQKT